MGLIKKVLSNIKTQEDKAPGMKLMTLEEIGQLKNDIFILDRSKMLLRMFEAHGKFCASHPWEVILVTVSLVLCSISLSFVEPNIGTGHPVLSMSSKMSDIAIPAITRCLAIVYIYLQFSKLRNLGSKYPLGITGVLTLIFSFFLRGGMINIVGADIRGLSEATTIFLLLVDLSKACTLAKFALSSKCQDEIISNMGQGMAIVGPMMTLDAVVGTLMIGVGTLSGVQTLQAMCFFGCFSVIANYFAFMTFYPACLAIVLEWTSDHRRLVQIQQLANVWQSDNESQNPNPVAQKVKMIMSAGLLFVHIHTRFTSPLSFLEDQKVELMNAGDLSHSGADEKCNSTLWLSFFESFSGLSIDYFTITVTLVIVLSFKYIFLDPDSPDPQSSQTNEGQISHVKNWSSMTKSVNSSTCSEVGNGDSAMKKDYPSCQDAGSQTDSLEESKFYIGCDSSDEESEHKGKQLVNSATQTNAEYEGCSNFQIGASPENLQTPMIPRSLNECVDIYKSQNGPKELIDEEIVALVDSKHIPAYKLEDVLPDLTRAVCIRRRIINRRLLNDPLEKLPYLDYNYSYVKGQCCENVIGYVPVPVGVAGPLLMNGRNYMVPMATTEGCLVASTNRGCRALSLGKGVKSIVIEDAMTRAPVVKFETTLRAAEVKSWLECQENFSVIAKAFNGTSRFARLKKIKVQQVARLLYIRFCASTGDAMGMNMLSKGCQAALLALQEHYFKDMKILSLSGNVCTDKKPNAVNWIEGRGKSVVCEAIIPGSVVKNILKTDVDTLVSLNIDKNLKGSIVAGSIGGFNAQASNIVTAIFIATGQDPAQNVSSSNCLTVFEKEGTDDLYVSCTMPCLEVGTVGGGTILPPQSACLQMLGVQGSNEKQPGLNASTLANIICSTVLAGELSLMSALASGDLVKSHLKHNRSVANISQSPNSPPCLAS